MSKSRKTYQDRLLDMVETLRGQIGDGTYAPGMFLPGEKTLAETFSLSTNSVAKGLDRLAEEGLVEKIRRVGCKVVKKVTVRFGIHRKMDSDLGLCWMLEEFRLRYPHIEVAAVPIQESYESENMAEALLESGQFDVLLMNHVYYQDMREKDRLDLLQPLPPQEGVYPFIAERFGLEGGTAIRMIAFSPVVLAYNKKHFEEAGLPEPDSGWGWPELFDYSARLSSSSPDRYGFYFNVQSVFNRWPLLLIQQMARRGARLRPEAEDVMAAFRFLRDCLHAPGTVPGVISQRAGLGMFRTGRVSMMATTYFMLNEMMEEPSLVCDIAPMPYWTEPRTLLIWQGVGVYRHSPVLDEAVRLADFLGSKTAQQLLRDHTTSIPAYGKTLRAPGLDRRYPERFALYREIIPSYREPNDCGLTNRELGELHQLAMLFASGVLREEEAQEQVRKMMM